MTERERARAEGTKAGAEAVASSVSKSKAHRDRHVRDALGRCPYRSRSLARAWAQGFTEGANVALGFTPDGKRRAAR